MDLDNAIAIIGVGLRFPGANDATEFWSNLCAGRSAIVTLSDEELLARGASPADLALPNYVRRVARLRDPELFDPDYFGLTSREAQFADPQLRVLLEVCQEAIEHSGHVLNGTRTGIYVGVADNDFWLSNLIYQHEQAVGASLGNRIYIKKDYFATQLSHKLNLHGPSVSISTACSTALVAVHEACTHLLMYDCDYALAGACEIDLGHGYLYEEGGIVSRDGCVRAFDAGANGTVFGSGAGVVVLRRLEDALADRDSICAVILGTSINNDGRRKAGFTAPSVSGQAAVISEALARAGVTARQVSYVETHGTGTLVGDPIEIQALTEAFAQDTREVGFCAIGSVKTNIGHLSIAAGIAGLIKASLCLQHRQLPPTLNFSVPNPAIDFGRNPFAVNTQLRDWETPSNLPRIAGVSAFGIGGTNSHAVLTEAPARTASDDGRPVVLLPLSAQSSAALDQARNNLARHVQAQHAAGLADIAYTLQMGRAELTRRCALVCPAGASAEAFANARWLEEVQSSVPPPRVAFMFPGQGSQYVGMARGLYQQEPAFAREIDECADALHATLGLDIRELLFPRAEDLESAAARLLQTQYTQPALFVICFALAKLLMSWGLKPAVLIGHSVGEYVAACIAGVVSRADALRLVATRGRLMQSAPAGAMLSVAASHSRVESMLPAGVAICVVNSDEQCVVGGPRAALAPFKEQCERAGMRVQWLQTSHAFHTSMMDDVLPEFRRAFMGTALQTPQIPIMSNVDGQPLEARALDPEYWVTQLRATVRFADCVRTATRAGADLFIEVGPGAALTTLLQQFDQRTVQLLRHPKIEVDDLQFLLTGLARAWCVGVAVDWQAFHGAARRNRVPLPTYPFQRRRFWLEPVQPRAATGRLTRRRVHPLLGQRWVSAGRAQVFENFIKAQEPAYLQDHRLMQAVIFPGAGYAEMALAAARLQFGSRALRIESVTFERALMLAGDAPHAVQMVVHEHAKQVHDFEITSLAESKKARADGSWHLHSCGRFGVLEEVPALQIDLPGLRARIQQPVDLQRFYAPGSSINYGERFQALAGLWVAEREALGRVELPAALHTQASEYTFHPVLLDACFQCIGAFSLTDQNAPTSLPVALRNFTVHAKVPAQFWVHLELLEQVAADGLKVARIAILDDAGQCIAAIERYEQRLLTRDVLEEPESYEELFHQIAWVEQDEIVGADAARAARSACVFTDEPVAAAALAKQLQRHDCAVQVLALEAACDGATLQQALALSGREHCELIVLSLRGTTTAITAACDALLRIAQQASDGTHPGPFTLAIVTCGSQCVAGSTMRSVQQVSGAALWGMGASITKECPALQCLRIDLDPHMPFNAWQVARELRQRGSEDLIAYRGATRYVARLRRFEMTAPAAANEAFRIAASEFGTFDALRPVQLQRAAPEPRQVEVELHAAGLNFKETLITLGLLPLGKVAASDVPLGFEGAGRITRVGAAVAEYLPGDAVIVWANGCLASHLCVDVRQVIAKPSALTFEQAASLPTVFMTAHHALHGLAQLRSGERILIHAGAGGVGQAAIQLARAAGAEIFVTASRGKWEYLRAQGVQHVFDSRSLDFAQQIERVTAGRGVNVVLNSLTGDFIEKSFEVLAPRGRFVEIGKLNIWSEEQARARRPDVAYHAFELGVGASGGPQILRDLLTPVLQGMQEGVLQPLPVRVFPTAEVVTAFRWLAAGRNLGKGVIRLRGPQSFAVAGATIQASKQYLISGGLGALGLHVADWLVSSGARDLTLLSRREPASAVTAQLQQLRSRGATVRVANCDVADCDSLGAVIAGLPALAGVFHCAGVLDDGAIGSQHRARLHTVLAPKVQGVLNLHELTAARELDQFVCFSSTSASLDGAGQINYAAANAYLDAFVQWRRAVGKCGTSIGWGAWEGEGMAAKLAGSRHAASFLQKEEGQRALGDALCSDQANLIVSRLRSKLTTSPPAGLWSELLERTSARAPVANQQFDQVLHDHAGNAPDAVRSILRREVGKVLGIAAEAVGDDESFIDVGIDSLMLAELRNNLQKSLAKSIGAAAFFAHATVSQLTSYIVAQHFAPALGVEGADTVQPRVQVVTLNELEHAANLFCVPGIGGNLFDFKALAECSTQRRICVLHQESAIPPAGAADEITLLAQECVAAMRRHQPRGPYHILGFSFGGSVAVAMAQRLQAESEGIASLTLMDAVPFFWHRHNPVFQQMKYLLLFDTLFEALRVPREAVNAFRAQSAGASAQQSLALFRQCVLAAVPEVPLTMLDEVMDAHVRRVEIDYQPPRHLANLTVTHIKALRSLQALAAPLTASIGPAFLQPLGSYGWEEILSNDIAVLPVDCSHLSLLQPPFVQRVAVAAGCSSELTELAEV